MIPIEEEMKGKVAVITGANTGIGFGCAKVFSEAGMNVVMAARRKEKGEAAAAELNAAGKGECTFFQCDVSDPDQVKALIDFAVEKYGRLDTMVNNAGYNPIHMDACDMSIESYQRVLATNLMGEFYGCKFAIPHLRKTKGSIINMSSILSKVGQEQTAGYSSTKGGINSMTQTIAIEEARHGVRVNAICPGHIMTEIVYKEMERVADPEAYLDRCNHYSWLGRGGQPEEVGTAALFLASSWASYITGVTLNVSGGMEFGTIPKYYAFDASAEKMKNNTQEEN
ncbi:MAG: glucose 1-dehydrogenase [Dysosmobacter sp.]|jgi:NAD(P)-dependent dehydrogenase (short-subunit alcohol dehydrogenase family)|uniref:SDR family NAD(P)-dependent oxidoreductase n=1 Tax=Dysosmobacter sp. TaxID=2591382 RepID=UPI0026383D6D|nr:glucose 1-dehydrogenase [Dysosmobacter sp.]MDR3983462.1 glucose 1-dehydrogenase [Dysosmobacter sp.]